MTEKPIIISNHAKLQMNLRGAERDEVITTIRQGEQRSAKQGRTRSRYSFKFNNISPVNNQYYAKKDIEVILTEKIDNIIVITVIVYYYN